MNAIAKISTLLIVVLTLQFSIAEEKPYTILISFDGFRWDYPNRGITPNLEKFKQNGVSALSLEPVYPTKTFPSHISLVTGMYPENHGIILNDFVNPFNGEEYNTRNRAALQESKWYSGEFFWETAQRQGIITASYFWPGSEVLLEHRRPTYRFFYDHYRPYKERIAGVLEWLQLPENERPHFITLYFHETDSKGHEYSPVSPEVNEAVKLLDKMLRLLMEGLEKIQMLQKTNLIVVSDHGMTAVDTGRVVNVEEWLSGSECRYTGEGPFLMLRPPEGKIDTVYALLKQKANHYRVYRREEVPDFFHFSNHPFIPPIVLIADLGWSLHTYRSLEKLLQRGYGKGGNHGYDNHQLDMHGIFYAMGPAFKKGYRTGTLRSIDIYPLLCKIFGIVPPKNIDGELERISFILQEN
jgi:predicted AlkP superfamily pyrophosphatase or phosphodiesterase